MKIALAVWGALIALGAVAVVSLLVFGATCVVPDVQGNTLVASIRRFDTRCFQPDWTMRAYLVLLDWQVSVGLILGMGALAWAALAKELL